MLLASAITLLLASAPTPSTPVKAELELAVLGELNRVRATPETYLPVLSAYRSEFRGDVAYDPGSGEGVETSEGERAVEEAVLDLQRRGAVPILAWDDRLAASAAELAEDQARAGGEGHTASDGSSFASRLARHVGLTGEAGEIIAYGETTQQAVVRALIVDDGVPQRSHRRSVFGTSFRRAGIACRPHPAFGMSCVVDLST